MARLGLDGAEKPLHPFAEAIEAPRGDGLADLSHQAHVEAHVVYGVEPGGENFAGLEQVAQVRAGEGRARIARAFGVEGLTVVAVAGVFDDDATLAGEERPGAGVTGRDDAVEKIDAPGDLLD